MKNIIIEGTDASGKEQIGKILEKIFNEKKIHLNNILALLEINSDNFSKDDFKSLLNYYSEKNIISDRSIFSLLNYFLMTDNSFLDNKFFIRKILKDYLYSINGGTIIFLTSNYEVTKKRLEFRKDELKEELSENDKKIIENELFFKKYKFNMDKLLKLSRKIVENEKLDIKFFYLDTSFINIFVLYFIKKLNLL